MLSYRLLPADEWHKVRSFFTERGKSLPHPQLARIVVAEDDGQVVGFLVKQLIAHMEPLSIAPSFRGKVSWKRMANMLDLNNTFVFADSPQRERMCELAGMRKIPQFTVYVKETE